MEQIHPEGSLLSDPRRPPIAHALRSFVRAASFATTDDGVTPPGRRADRLDEGKSRRIGLRLPITRRRCGAAACPVACTASTGTAGAGRNGRTSRRRALPRCSMTTAPIPLGDEQRARSLDAVRAAGHARRPRRRAQDRGTPPGTVQAIRRGAGRALSITGRHRHSESASHRVASQPRVSRPSASTRWPIWRAACRTT